MFRSSAFGRHRRVASRVRHAVSPGDAAAVAVIDPLVRFGRPTVNGVATDRLWELFDAGEPLDEIAEGYELELPLVSAAVAYEEQLRSLAA